MSATMTGRAVTISLGIFGKSKLILSMPSSTRITSLNVRQFMSYTRSSRTSLSRLTVFTGAGLLVGGYYVFDQYAKSKYTLSTVPCSYTDFGTPQSNINVSRHVPGKIALPGIQITLFQYQTCPFCCKVRTYLDYHGFAYNIVEVNSVSRKDIKWSSYPKVPILLLTRQNSAKSITLLDSSNIISILESFLARNHTNFDELCTFFPVFKGKNEKGKVEYDFSNKYDIMVGSEVSDSVVQLIKKERKWRRWVNDHFVHTLSPNIYRTRQEALQAFHYFSEIGQWEKHFSNWERLCVVYVGAIAMYFVGKKLKRKYHLNDDVRQSLYSGANVWLKALGSNKFLGGELPCLADLEVFGALSAIEGCSAFDDLIQNTNIQRWYDDVKVAVTTHQGEKRWTKRLENQ